MLQDSARVTPFQAAVKAAVEAVLAEDKDVRVLHLGCGSGESSRLSHLKAWHTRVNITITSSPCLALTLPGFPPLKSH